MLVFGAQAPRRPARTRTAGLHGAFAGRLAAVGVAGNLARSGPALASRLAAAGVRCAQIPAAMATRGFLRRAHALSLQVHVWTVNDRTEMTCLLDLGADGIMTDEVVLLRDVLAKRGQWHPADRGRDVREIRARRS